MEGLLVSWALAAQEYEFTISHRIGTANTNADAFFHASRPLLQNKAQLRIYFVRAIATI